MTGAAADVGAAGAILDWGLQTGLMVAILIAFVLIIRRPFARVFGARATYALWLLPAMRLVMPQVTIPRIFPQAAPEPVMPELTLVDLRVTEFVPAQFDAVPTASFAPDIMAALPVLALIVWAAGAIGFVAYHFISQSAQTDNLAYLSDPISPRLQACAKSSARVIGIKRLPEIRRVDGNIGPLVCNVMRPTIFLPEDFERRFTPAQQRFALLHELSHVKRGDLWAAWAWLIFRALNWPNPLVHFANRAFRSDQEAACDATVLDYTRSDQRDVIAYAETLLHAAKLAVPNRTSVSIKGCANPSLGQLALTIHQPLKERLIMLNHTRKSSNWRARAGASALIIAAFGLTAPLTQADGRAEAHPELHQLAGKSHSSGKDDMTHKSVIQISKTDKYGKAVRKHFEVSVKDGEIEAYEICGDGTRTRIDQSEIEGVSAARLSSSTPLKFGLTDDHKLKLLSEAELREKQEAKTAAREARVEARRSAREARAESRRMAAESRRIASERNKEAREAMKEASRERAKARTIFRAKDDDVVVYGDVVDGRFEMPEPPEMPEMPDFPDGFPADFDVDAMHLKSRMHAAESMLAQAERMIAEAERGASGNRDISNAKREIEKARKALKKAEKSLKNK